MFIRSSAILVILLIALGLILTTPGEIFGQVCQKGAGTTSTNVINGLITGKTVQSFTSDTGNCINNTTAKIPAYEFPTYADLKSLYFTQTKATTHTIGNSTPCNSAPTYDQSSIKGFLAQSDSTMLVYGNLTITGDVNATSPSVDHTGIVFVECNLNIGPGTFPTTTFNSLPHTGMTYGGNGVSGLVFVVQGDIYIDKNVDWIDAVLISGGQICTAYNLGNLGDSGNIGVCPKTLNTTAYYPAFNNIPLIINGSLISLTAVNNQDIKFSRSLYDNTQAAEQVFTQPKYLVILKNLFTQPFTITTNL